MTVPICTYELSEGDVANYNIRFASIPLSIAPAFIGGSSEKAPASKSLYVFLGSAEPERRWLYGDKKILNNRTEITRRFYEEIGVRPKMNSELLCREPISS
jgi:hypothetical protein